MNIKITQLQVHAEHTEILKGIDFILQEGTLNILMGPNGSGKSTLSHVIVGNPRYEVSGGSIEIDGQNIVNMAVNERAKLGIFMSFQDPIEVTGITVGRFLRRAYEVIHGEVPTGFVKILRKEIAKLGIDQSFINRYLNEGFSGGEKKRIELLQARVLKPKFLILDEIDSGLDIDAIKMISNSINEMRRNLPSMTILVVTHYRRIIDHLERVNGLHVMNKGKIAISGSIDLLDRLEGEGYGWINDEIVGGNDE